VEPSQHFQPEENIPLTQESLSAMGVIAPQEEGGAMSMNAALIASHDSVFLTTDLPMRKKRKQRPPTAEEPNEVEHPYQTRKKGKSDGDIWTKYYEQLKVYSLKNNNCDVPVDFEVKVGTADHEETLQLGIWLQQQKEKMYYYATVNPERHHLLTVWFSGIPVPSSFSTSIPATAGAVISREVIGKQEVSPSKGRRGPKSPPPPPPNSLSAAPLPIPSPTTKTNPANESSSTLSSPTKSSSVPNIQPLTSKKRNKSQSKPKASDNDSDSRFLQLLEKRQELFGKAKKKYSEAPDGSSVNSVNDKMIAFEYKKNNLFYIGLGKVKQVDLIDMSGDNKKLTVVQKYTISNPSNIEEAVQMSQHDCKPVSVTIPMEKASTEVAVEGGYFKDERGETNNKEQSTVLSIKGLPLFHSRLWNQVNIFNRKKTFPLLKKVFLLWE
jgi:hypothetical protein